MSPLTNAARRLLRIAWGYLLASVAAGYTLVLLAMVGSLIVEAIDGRLTGPASSTAMGFVVFWLWIGAYAAALVAAVALVPALPVIAVAEARGLQSARFYAIAGAIGANLAYGLPLPLLAGWLPNMPGLLSALLRDVSSPAIALATILLWVVCLGTAGLVGGLVYWRIAGGNAGDRGLRTIGRLHRGTRWSWLGRGEHHGHSGTAGNA